MKKTFCVAAIMVMTAALGACGSDNKDSSDASSGGGGGGDYCSTLQDTKAEFENLDFTALNEEKFDALQSKIDALQSAAPDEVKDDWGTLGDAFDQFKSLLDDAGISLDDLESMQSGGVPSGVDLKKLQQLGTKLQAFSADSGLEDASKNIEDHAKSECNISLNDSGATTSP
jgi:hypothetical protein